MAFIKGNKAIRDHAANGKDLLLFETTKTKGLCRYIGSFVCDFWHMRTAPDKNGAPRTAIVFKLIPLENLDAGSAASVELDQQTVSLEELRRRAFAAAGGAVQTSGKTKRTIYTRSRDVRVYVLARANGTCEACNQPAPFKREDGTPYLEPHHTRRVSDGGPDHPRWVGATCPTCHRLIHHGLDGAQLNAQLQKRLGELEASEN